ncbi:MAG: DUF2461 domain-containing protein [Pedobacter sp.]|nr:MAG: DUF2461 domain-containing protein [Pedobacter sp.]
MIKVETLKFIRDVAENNDRDWFAANKDRYETARADVFDFIELLIPELAAVDPEFSIDTPAKKCLLRIYRDVRFSKNKDPYKNNYGISFNVKGKGIPSPDYYLHIQPDKSFFGVGFWMPESPVLKKIREEIDYNASEFLGVVGASDFTKLFQLSEEGKLKNMPKGYEIDHPQIEYLKLKSFIAIMPIKDEELLKPQIVDKLKTAFNAIQPFVLFLRNAVSQ